MNRAAARLAHRLDRVLRAEEHPGRVDGHDVVPVLEVRVPDPGRGGAVRKPPGDARRVEHDVEPAETLAHRRHRLVPLVLRGRVEVNVHRRPAGRLDLAHHLRAEVVVDVGDRDRRPVLGEEPRARRPRFPDAPPVIIATLFSSRLPTAIFRSSRMSHRRKCTRCAPKPEPKALSNEK